MQLTKIFKLIVLFLKWMFVIALGCSSIAAVADIWTLSGPSSHMTLRAYTDLTNERAAAPSMVTELESGEPNLDERSEHNRPIPTLEAVVLSPDAAHLFCHWRDGHSIIRVYDVHSGKLLLNWNPPDTMYYHCDWLNADEIWLNVYSPINPQATLNTYIALSVTTGHTRDLKAKESKRIASALEAERRRIKATARVFRSMGYRERYGREMGSTSVEGQFENHFSSSSTGATSHDGSLAILWRDAWEWKGNTPQVSSKGNYYQILYKGNPYGRLDREILQVDSVVRVSFVEDKICFVVTKSGKYSVQVWGTKKKLVLLANIEGEEIVDHSLTL